MNKKEFEKKLKRLRTVKRSSVLPTRVVKDKTKYTRKVKHK
jgi:hypothetical protein